MACNGGAVSAQFLSQKERMEVAALHHVGLCGREGARLLERAPSTSVTDHALKTGLPRSLTRDTTTLILHGLRASTRPGAIHGVPRR